MTDKQRMGVLLIATSLFVISVTAGILTSGG